MRSSSDQNVGVVSAPTPVEVDGPGPKLIGDRWSTSAPRRRGELVLLHGGGQTRHSWGQAAAEISRSGWDVITYDARGHGDSARAPDGGYGVDTFVADLARVVDTCTSGSPVLVGASLGGITSLLAVGEGSVTASALALVDVTPRVNVDGVRRIHGFMLAHPHGFESLDDVADAVAAYTRRPRKKPSAGLRKNVSQGRDGRWRWHWDPAFITPETAGRPLADEERLYRAAGAVTIPVLLVHGLTSDLVTESEISEFVERVPHADVAHVDAGHMVAGDDNDAFTTTILNFLRA